MNFKSIYRSKYYFIIIYNDHIVS